MTLDSTSDSTPSEPTADSVADRAESPTTPARKPARRRATRSAAPPQTPPAPAAAPAASDGATPTAASAVDATPAPEAPVDAPAAEAATKPARRSRRATRTTPSVAAPVADAAPAAAAAPATGDVPAGPSATEPAPRARTTRRAQTGGKKAKAPAADAPLDVLSEFGLSAPPAAEQAPAPAVAPDADALLGAADAPRRAKRTRATRTTTSAPAVEAAPVTEPDALTADAAPSATEPAPVTEPTAAEPVETPAAKKPARRSRRATSAAAPAPEAPAAEAPAPAVEDAPSAAEPTPAEAEAPTSAEPAKKPARRSRRATSKPAAEAAPEATGAAESPAASESPAAPASSAPADGPASPAATGAGTSTPRLATTALLFQAPDPAAAPRRPRRAQSPAGPPRHVEPAASAPATTEPTAAEPTAATEPTATPEPATATRGRRGRKASAPESRAAESRTAAEPSTPAAEPTAAEIVLTGEDAAAVEEIEAIESELVAEGVEVPEDAFGPEDFVELDEAEEPEEQPSADDADAESGPRRRRRRGGRGRRGRPDGARDQDREQERDQDEDDATPSAQDDEPVDAGASADAEESDQEPGDADQGDDEAGGSRRRRRRRRGSRSEGEATTTRSRPRERSLADEVTALKGSTRLEAKRQRRREGRDAGRRRQIITEAEFLARRESVERSMVVRERDGRTQIAVLEDGVLVEHYVSQQSQASMAGNVYLGRVQNVLPSMEAAFIDVGKGRNAVLYAGEVNWDAAGLEGQPRRIEQALKSGDSVLVQVTKDPIGHKGARLTSQITLAGRYLVFVPGGGMTGISRKLPDTERNRLKKILKEVVPDGAGVIVRTAAEGASEEELRADVERLRGQWEAIEKKSKSASAPALLQGEPDLAIRVVRDIFNDDFSSLVVEGDGAWSEISTYVEELAPDLRERVSKWTGTQDVFTVHRVDEQLAKGMDRKVWLPSGGSLVIDRTEAMTVVDVNTGKFTGSGGTLEETVTRNNLEAAEEIVRQLRLRDIGGIIVIDFIDMVLESNRDLVLRRLVECLGRDRTKHQVAEVTSLGLVQMTRKRVGQGLVEAFSETCEHCHGRGFIVHTDPIEKSGGNRGNHDHGNHGNGNAGGSGGGAAADEPAEGGRSRSRRKRGSGSGSVAAAPKDTGITLPQPAVPVLPEVTSEARAAVKATLATIAAAAAHAHEHDGAEAPADGSAQAAPVAGDDGGSEPAES
ncbi:Rne/Rng family ribonuclease [Cellulosimicrobium sp. TH-20]|uniref:Rne/Rng family ribonuclease n=1 Tax=Cellulosimicrobium sp. TH-20 TaxID=1980001 RepID=UPI0021046E8C